MWTRHARIAAIAALANPALVTVALVLAGLPSAMGGAFLVPAAPNLAHFVFFAVCARAGPSARAARGRP